MSRTKLAAGNWKMFKTFDEVNCYCDELIQLSNGHFPKPILIASPSIFLGQLINRCKNYPSIKIAAQNCHHEKQGAFTGEISAAMVKSVGATHVILGHSERRTLFGESDNLISLKVKAVLAEGLTPVFCCGEPLEVRNEGKHFDLNKEQVSTGLFDLSAEDLNKVIIAYEPVWAIGTGLTASPEQAQEMHQFIRGLIAAKYGQDLANSIRILYGGSVKPDNANELFSQPDVDGGLVGGASLKAADFYEIYKATLQ